MRKGIFIFLFTNVYISLFSQMDSLLNVYQNESDDVKAKAIMMKVQSLCKKDINCYLPFKNYAASTPYSEIHARLYSHLVSAQISSFSYDEARSLGLLASRRIERENPNSKWLAQVYQNIATAYIHLSKSDSALYFINKSERQWQKLADQANYWKPDYARYTAYYSISNKMLALDYLKKSYTFLKNSGDRMNKGFILVELLTFTKKQGLDSEFNTFLEDYIAFSKQGNKSMDAIHTSLSSLYKEDKDGIAILEQKLKNLEKLESNSTANNTLIVDHMTEKMKLIDLYAKYGQNLKAISNLKNILKDSIQGDVIQKTTLQKLANIYKEAGQWDSAFIYTNKLNAEINKTFQNNLSQKIAEYEVKYQTQHKENELIKQKATIAENKLKLQRSYGVLVGLGILSLLLFLFYRHKIKIQKLMNSKEQEIQNQKISHLEQENKVLALNAMIEGQEAERLRIAHDLHDGLGGLLTTVKAHFNAIEREINAVKNLNVYDQTNDLIDKACIEVRRIAHNMVPHSIHISGLAGALDDLKQSIESRGLTCELDLHGIDDLAIDQQKASMLYRIIQEVTNNTIKHAEASHVLIQLIKSDAVLHIMIEDNGKGFDINNIQNNKGMGLRSIESRVKYLDGKIFYDSAINYGTTVNIEVAV